MDFRSDMLGRRPESVMRAIAEAVTDAPSMEDDEDPRMRKLQDRMRELSGCEAALLLPTCTMANQVAIRIHCPPGHVILADETSHLVNREAAAATTLNASILHPLPGERGHLSPELVGSALGPRVRLVWLENTHNAAGGTVMPAEWLPEIAARCRAERVALHLDGSRLWNASAATGIPIRHLVQGCDSVAISLNKSLDVPMGALLLGSNDFIERARGIRQILGGFWRPIGPIAAAANSALQDGDKRIAQVHALARRFYWLLRERLPDLHIGEPETNIVMLHLGHDRDVETFLQELRRAGIQALGYGGPRVRFVLHSGISADDLVIAANAVASALRSR